MKSFAASIATSLWLLASAALASGTTGLTTGQIRTAAPSAVDLSGVAAAEGTALGAARSDHRHNISAPTCSAGQALTSTDGTHLTCGGSGYTVSSVTGDTTAAATKHQLLRVTTISANLAITLPAAASIEAGGDISILDVTGSAGTGQYLVKIVGNGSETIDGFAAIVLVDDYARLTLVSNGTNWDVLASGPGAGYTIDLRTINGLKGWWQADRRTMNANGYHVASLYDMSGNGLTATPAQGTPLLRAKKDLGQRDAVVMSPSDVATTGAANFSTSSTTFSAVGITAISVMHSDEWRIGTYEGIVSCNFSNTGNGFSVGKSGDNPGRLRMEFNAQTNNPALADPAALGGNARPTGGGDDGTHKYLLTFRGSNSAGDATIRVNGVKYSMINASAKTLGTVTGSIYLGQSHYTGVNNDQWVGHLYMVAIWDAVVSDANILLAERGIRRAWGY